MADVPAALDGVKYSPVGKPADGVARKKSKCTPSVRLTGIVLLSLLTLLFLAGSIVIWGTDIFHSFILQNLVIRNNSRNFDWWVEPPVQPLARIYIFNYTNAAEFEAGLVNKLHVNEIGPFTFKQHMSKVNVEFTHNETVLYRDDFSFEFIPEMSVGSLNATKLTLMNMPLVCAISMLRKRGYFVQITAKTVMARSPFLHIDVGEFLWGYQEAMATLSSIFASFGVSSADMRLGFLEARSGVGRFLVEAETGARDMERLGIIVSVDGEPRLREWGDTECSRIDGTDGTMFPPHQVETRAPVHIFNKEMCRRLPFEFYEDHEIDGIPARRYRPPRNVFARGDVNPENACFCPGEECPPGGVFNASPCAYGAPVMISLPHFYLADEELQQSILGLKPDPKKHDIFLDIHPTLGVAIMGKTRMQFNVRVEKSPLFKQLDRFEEGAILPIAWMEVGIDKLPPNVHSMLYDATNTMDFIHHLLQWGLLVLTIVCVVLLACSLRRFALDLRSRRRTTGKENHVLKPL